MNLLNTNRILHLQVWNCGRNGKGIGSNSVNIGGKRLYLGPWSDGSQFKRNAIKSISTWIRLIDVPHSYWSIEGLGNIAKVVGKPICLDNQTAQLNPMKFAGVLVQLKYGSNYPRGVWVPVINEEDGSIVKVKVGIEYSAVPQSCKFCQALVTLNLNVKVTPLYEANRRNDKPKAASNINKPAEDGSKNADADVTTDAATNVDEEVIDKVNDGNGTVAADSDGTNAADIVVVDVGEGICSGSC